MRINNEDALIVVDVQNDFCPGGAMPVEGGDEIAKAISGVALKFRDKGGRVFATQDWHPAGHSSFEQFGGPFPPHCVQVTEGAAFHPDLRLPVGTSIIRKGVDRGEDALSGFSGTGLEEQLTRAGTKRVFVGGLATDYCVLETILDAKSRGFETYVLTDMVRALDDTPDAGEKAIARMRDEGATVITSEGMFADSDE